MSDRDTGRSDLKSSFELYFFLVFIDMSFFSTHSQFRRWCLLLFRVWTFSPVLIRISVMETPIISSVNHGLASRLWIPVSPRSAEYTVSLFGLFLRDKSFPPGENVSIVFVSITGWTTVIFRLFSMANSIFLFRADMFDVCISMILLSLVIMSQM